MPIFSSKINLKIIIFYGFLLSYREKSTGFVHTFLRKIYNYSDLDEINTDRVLKTLIYY